MVHDSDFRRRCEDVIERIEETSEYQEFRKQNLSPDTEERKNAIHYTPIETVNRYLAAVTVSGAIDWSNIDTVLSACEKTGVWAVLAYIYIREFTDKDNPEECIHITSRNKDKGRVVHLFEYSTGVPILDDNIHTIDLWFEYNNSNVGKPLYATEDSATPIFKDILEPIIEKDNRKHRIKGFEANMQFDLVLGNPPYEAPQKHDGKKGGGSSLWIPFAEKALDNLVSSGGYLLYVHPPLYRKPQSDRSWCSDLQEKYMGNWIQYLNINDTHEGKRVFGAGTRFDVILIQKTDEDGKTLINDENGKMHEIDMSNYSWIPNHSFDFVDRFIAEEGEEKTGVIFDRTAYGTDKRISHTQKEQEGDYQYPLVHSTAKTYDGLKCYYSSTKENGHFGTPKVIVGDSVNENFGVYSALVDMEGEYGMTQHAMALPAESEEEAKKIKKALESDTFIKILDACTWSNFQLDWRMLRDLRKDWYETVLEIEKQRNND